MQAAITISERRITLAIDHQPGRQCPEHGFRVAWGIYPPGGATAEQALSPRRYLLSVPYSGEELPFSRHIHQWSAGFEFDAEERGKRVFFCLRELNGQDGAGPWGPVLMAVIP